jgi:hypothetical protein
MNTARTIKLFVCLLTAVAILVPAMAWAETDCQAAPMAAPIGTQMAICTMEMITGVGAIVWAVRAKMDGWKCAAPHWYCVIYSKYCPHYSWQKGCLRRELNKTNYPNRNCFK